MITSDHAIAHHEAAHLVAAVALGLPFVAATIEDGSHARPCGAVELLPDQSVSEDVAVACLAGLVSSEVLLGSAPDAVAPEQRLARRDVENANALVLRLAEGDAARAERLFLELVQRAEELLRARTGLWQRLTRALIAQGRLDRGEVRRLVAEEQRL
jgi:hypothetical protein